MEFIKKYGFWIACAVVFFLFCYFRLNTIYFQTVAYTYDQGRDFLKAAEIVLYKNLTFIGPTTGIVGVYHGAWWYYVLTLPFFLFKGSPIGFYYFLFGLHTVSFAALVLFLRKYTDTLTALVAGSITAISPYFIFRATFAGNNIMVLPPLILFLICSYYLLSQRVSKNMTLISFLSGLCLGLVSEFEFAFGLFIIPAYFLCTLLIPTLRTVYRNHRNLLAGLVGLAIPFLPRLLFEVKHDFSQTRILLSFFLHPKLHNPRPYIDAFNERLILFRSFYEGLFQNDITYYLVTGLCAVIIALVILKKVTIHRTALLFFVLLLTLLFGLSTFYKDFFWENYYEGMPYLFLMIIAVLLSAHTKNHQFQRLITGGKVLILTVLFSTAITMIQKNINSPRQLSGLSLQTAVVNYILNNENNKQQYCVKVYTPPVVPYTYDYLFLHNKLSKGYENPSKDFVNNHCWYILESDSFEFRIKEWMKNNIPEESTVVKTKRFDYITVELRKLAPTTASQQ